MSFDRTFFSLLQSIPYFIILF